MTHTSFHAPHVAHPRRAWRAHALRGLIAAAAAVVAGFAQAGLLAGSQVTGAISMSHGWGQILAPTAAPLTDPGTEFVVDPPGLAANSSDLFADLAPTTLHVGLRLTTGRQSGVGQVTTTFQFSNLHLDPGEEIIGLSMLNYGRNFGSASFSFTADSITVVFFNGLYVGPGFQLDNFDDVTLQILTGPVSAVPAPATPLLAALGAGLALAASPARRRKSGGTRA